MGRASLFTESLTLIGDTTQGLTQEGVVRLRLPNQPSNPLNPTGLGVYVFVDPDQRGSGQFPPALDDDTEKKILFWIRAFRLNQSRIAKVQFVGANATETVQTTLAAPEFLGTGDAQPNQRYRLVKKPVIAGSLVVEVETAHSSLGRKWMASSPAARWTAISPSIRKPVR